MICHVIHVCSFFFSYSVAIPYYNSAFLHLCLDKEYKKYMFRVAQEGCTYPPVHAYAYDGSRWCTGMNDKVTENIVSPKWMEEYILHPFNNSSVSGRKVVPALSNPAAFKCFARTD